MAASDVIVVGAGALGLAVAAELRLRGRDVRVIAPAEINASARAAGMIAPAFESVLGSASQTEADVLRRARDLWPAFAERTGITLHRRGAEWRGADAGEIATRMRALGFSVELRGEVLFTPEDWVLEPGQALAALAGDLPRATARMTRLEGQQGDWRVTTACGDTLAARQAVLATGWADPQCGIDLPPLHPIRGQAVRVVGPAPERVVRAEGVYVVPQGDGAIIGATMEAGRSDTDPDPLVTERLLTRAREVCPELGEARAVEAYAAVRGASPDGWPYAGLWRPGLALALAPRRNGWLLAPRVAKLVADALEGGDPDADGCLLRPDRPV